jgi:uncharacterized protein (DUF58 family)
MLPAPFTNEFLNRLEVLRLRTRKEVLGNRPGAYASPRRGTSLEFADYRKYSPGDDLRYVDWGIFARTDRMYVRLFHEEVELFAYVFIDASASMAFPSPREKFTAACNVALAVSYVVLANQDHVRLHALNAPNSASPFLHGRNKIVELIDFTRRLTPAGAPDLAASLGDHLQRVRRPGKAILISDFLVPAASYQKAFNLLRTFNLDVAAVQVLSRAELEPPLAGELKMIDSESGEEVNIRWNAATRRAYGERLERHNRELKSACHQSGVQYALYPSDGDLTEFVLQTLPEMRLFK